MIFTVFHAIAPTFGYGPTPIFPYEYDEVATVETSSINDVFRLTNHVEIDWTHNPEVLKSKAICRSTSVGDVVVDQDRKIFLCQTFGWKEMTKFVLGHLDIRDTLTVFADEQDADCHAEEWVAIWSESLEEAKARYDKAFTAWQRSPLKEVQR